ncbi:hypothetical protein A3844_09650 [Paenibacillus helianthi]|uniref:DUF423 domain-containing protein n=1 Tax=Paenibacillus helianthi TaxID=1349432 RepID=A0ABX3EPL8_9BACL|nr:MULTISPECIES: DUF423 domain-containing protein [Paenibacillus]OKP73725.1 hypothetical protein A3842_21585 [Paenibacillus sp. P3E]OKP87668.1 hypothetical protein A3844_09650 [Paenibacillus helianthi]OKP93332.1 hypothetical protein A3848_04980 [Paenibacillus sp. P32E]
MQRRFIAYGALLVMLSVGIGAFGAHLLKTVISEDYLKVYETGVHYHMIHALGLILIGLAAGQWGESSRLRLAGRLLMLGIIFFSGSLYMLSITGIKVLGAITPLGGVCFIAGWLCLAWEAFSRKD